MFVVWVCVSIVLWLGLNLGVLRRMRALTGTVVVWWLAEECTLCAYLGL